MGRLITWVVVLLLAGAGLYFYSPWFRNKVDDTLRSMKEWDAEARRKNPVGFIDFAMKRLGENVGKFEQVRVDLRAAGLKLEDMKKENQGKLAFADKELASLKASYKEATGGKGWPVEHAGRAYKEGELKSQVNVLLTQKGGYEAILKQIDASLATTEQRGNELLNRINESKAKLGILGAQKELVKVNQLTADSEKLLDQVQDVLLQNEAAAEKPAVRTVEELMKEAGQTPGASNASVDAFLNG